MNKIQNEIQRTVSAMFSVFELVTLGKGDEINECTFGKDKNLGLQRLTVFLPTFDILIFSLKQSVLSLSF